MPRSIARTAALTAAFALAVPALASADSIVYIDGGNVWSAAPDGSKKVQITDGGSWHSPTQADDGTVAAVQGTGPIQVMEPSGKPIRTITTQPAKTGNGGTFAARPMELAFSPDGTKIAYSYVAMSCPPGSTCTDQQSVFYTRADVTEATAQNVWGNQFGAAAPSWVTNDRTVVESASHVDIDPLGGGDYSYTLWINSESAGEDFGDPDVSPDGKRVAATFGYGPNKILAFMAVNGDVRTELPPAKPTAICNTNGGDETIGDASWSPDSSSVAFQSKEGINVVRFSAFGPSCGVAGEVILTPTGTQPEWGPANPPAARYTPPVITPGPGPAPQPTPGPAPVPTPAPSPGPAPAPSAVTFTVGKLTTSALRKGFAVKVTAPKAGKVTATLTSAGKRVATRTVTAKKAGQVTVKLPTLTAKRAKALRGRTLRLTVTAAGRTSGRSVKVA